MAGRPTSLTPAVAKKIIAALKIGVPRDMAVRAAGVGRSSFYRWLEQAKEPGAPQALQDFWDEVEKAEGAAVVYYQSLIKKAAPTSWQAAAWMLERRWPDDFGRKDRVSVEALKRTEAEEIARTLGLDPEEVLAQVDALLAGRS